MKSVTIGENDTGQHLDKLLAKAYRSLSQAILYKSIRKKDIKLNDKRCDIPARLNTGDVLATYLENEFFQQESEEYDFLKAPLELNILLEDEDILVLDKKSGLIVYPDENYHFDSLIARVRHYLHDGGEYRPREENSFVSTLANRIDRNTDGTVIAAKSARSLHILNGRVRNRELKKLYLCIVCGRTRERSATLEELLEKNGNQNRVYVSSHDAPGAESVRTRYRVPEERDVYSLLEIGLLIGRTHQIRAHLASIGHPLAGDGKYGINRQNKKTGLSYQALYSYKLRFEFTSPVGTLEHLNHREFEAKEIWSLKDFYSWGAQEGGRMQCTIRTWRPNDVVDPATAMNSPNILKNLRDGIPYPYTQANAEEYTYTMPGVEPGSQYAFTIDMDDRTIGNTGVSRQASTHFHAAEPGYYVAELYWGWGTCINAMRQICGYVFQSSDILCVFVEPFVHNATSCRVLEKTGLILEGTLRRNAFKNREILDVKLYSLIKQKQI